MPLTIFGTGLAGVEGPGGDVPFNVIGTTYKSGVAEGCRSGVRASNAKLACEAALGAITGGLRFGWPTFAGFGGVVDWGEFVVWAGASVGVARDFWPIFAVATGGREEGEGEGEVRASHGSVRDAGRGPGVALLGLAVDEDAVAACYLVKIIISSLRKSRANLPNYIF